ncbi:sterol homeostasis protein [Yamadazyma tenuis]|uniref:sterol homeostasis protein n=1 Tax=Candida tenuis TaxID=2315449 RepID=UPI0027A758F0|nr:sterol homeostasis protein [Yamadazyma tenuis]
MICVECKNPNVKHAYSKYKGDYIKLDVCSVCNHVVDKYVEYDNVLLFIDLMLLKPQAYRHLCFNLTENEMTAPKIPTRTPKGHKGKKMSLEKQTWKLGQITRFLILDILFEVYLLWAYEEKKHQHTQIMNVILSQELHMQYLLFTVKVVLDHVFFNAALQLIFFQFLGWNKMHNGNIHQNQQRLYHSLVLLTDILVANSIKLLPILMLIWPYDKTLESSKIVLAISILNVIESLKTISNVGYVKIAITFGA